MFNSKKESKEIEVVKVKTERLTIEEYRNFIDCVSNVVVFDNELHLENLEPVFSITTLNLFTEIPLIKKVEDDTQIDFDANYKFCLDNNVLDQVKEILSEEYINRLYQDCIDTIEFKKAMTIHKASSVSDEIILSVTGLINTVKTAVAKFDPAQYTDVIKLAKDMAGKNITNNSLAKAAIKNIVKEMPKKDVTNAEAKTDKVDNITPIPSPTEG